jgi:hypothetical protein
MSNNIKEDTGKIYKLGELKEFEGGFKKQDIFIECSFREYEGKEYSEIVRFKVEKRVVDDLAILGVGDEVLIRWVWNGRMWTPPDDPNKEVNFTEPKILSIQKTNVQPKTEAQAVNETVDAATNELFPPDNEPDDLPF